MAENTKKQINRDDFLSTTDFKRKHHLKADILHLAIKRIRKLNLQIKTPTGPTPVIKNNNKAKTHDTALKSMIDPRGEDTVLKYYNMEAAKKAKETGK